MDVIAQEWRKRRGEVVAPRQATREQLARVHSADHLRRIAETNGTSVALDQDTYTSPDTYAVIPRTILRANARRPSEGA